MVTEKKAPRAKNEADRKPRPRVERTTKTADEKAPVAQRHPMQRRRQMVGLVVSDKMTKTVVVKVDQRVLNAAYKKYCVRSQKFAAHDEAGTAKVGDLVSMVESRPMSKTKRWVVTAILRKFGQKAIGVTE